MKMTSSVLERTLISPATLLVDNEAEIVVVTGTDGTILQVSTATAVTYLNQDATPERLTDAAHQLMVELLQQMRSRFPLDEILTTGCVGLRGILGCGLVWAGTHETGGEFCIRARAGTAIASPAGMTAPLITNGRTAGMLCVQAAAAADLEGELIRRILDEVALLLSVAIEQDANCVQTAALQSAANAVLIADRIGRIVWVNQAFERMTGYAMAEVLGQTSRMLQSGLHTSNFYGRMWKVILSGETWHGELQNRSKDGRLYVEEQTITPVRDASGTITHFIAVKQDVTARKQHEEKLVQQAMHDPLTGLLNRRAWEEKLDVVANQARAGRAGALLLMDLDRFKQVNDTLGHAAGDQLLRELSRCMASALRREDLLARLGGDEFGAIMYDVTPDEAAVIAERLRTEVRDFTFRYGNSIVSPTVSIGLVPLDSRQTVEQLVAEVDAALYKAKEQGKNRTVLGRRAEEHGAAFRRYSDRQTTPGRPVKVGALQGQLA